MSSTNPITHLNVVLEDEHLLVVDKPAGVLSQPGKSIDGSIATLVKDSYPDATGSMLVHRLDMDTSGLMLFAKSKSAHRSLQQQFEKRMVTKRYTAVLSRPPGGIGGQVQLPLRLDVDSRPVQIVCHDHGKSACTLWKLAKNTGTHLLESQSYKGIRVTFIPITGRTHQLRVHAAHSDGLDAPIVGDRLYGEQSGRMLLHADQLGFNHPVTNKRILVESEAPF